MSLSIATTNEMEGAHGRPTISHLNPKSYHRQRWWTLVWTGRCALSYTLKTNEHAENRFRFNAFENALKHFFSLLPLSFCIFFFLSLCFVLRLWKLKYERLLWLFNIPTDWNKKREDRFQLNRLINLPCGCYYNSMCCTTTRSSCIELVR